MSVVQNPIIGRSRGKYSSSVFAKWKGLNTLRSKPLSVKQPNSLAQLTQRSIFAAAVSYARMVLTMIRYSLKYSAINLTEFNVMIKNLTSLINPLTFVIDTGKEDEIVFASGPEPGFEDTAVVYASGANVTFTWDDTFMEESRAVTDKVVAFIFNKTQNKMIAIDTNALYSAGSIAVAHGGATGDVMFIYAAVCTDSYSRFSPSQYFGTFTVS